MSRTYRRKKVHHSRFNEWYNPDKEYLQAKVSRDGGWNMDNRRYHRPCSYFKTHTKRLRRSLQKRELIRGDDYAYTEKYLKKLIWVYY